MYIEQIHLHAENYLESFSLDPSAEGNLPEHTAVKISGKKMNYVTQISDSQDGV